MHPNGNEEGRDLRDVLGPVALSNTRAKSHPS